MSRLEIKGLRGGYGALDEIVKGIDLSVAPGEVVVVIGPNGAGKSTLLKMVAGLVPFKSGSVGFGDASVRPGDSLSAIAAGLGFVPQEANVFASMSVRENLELGTFLDRRNKRDRIEAQFERFPMLRERSRQSAGSLSGGQRQLLALAIALIGSPRVLLLDEPTAGLSPAAADMLFDMVRQLAAEGLAILMVEQNALAALESADRGVVLMAGQKRMDDAAARLAADPEVRRVFLGRN